MVREYHIYTVVVLYLQYFAPLSGSQNKALQSILQGSYHVKENCTHASLVVDKNYRVYTNLCCQSQSELICWNGHYNNCPNFMYQQKADVTLICDGFHPIELTMFKNYRHSNMGKKKIVMRDLENAIRPKAKEVKSSLCAASFLIMAVKTFGCVIFYYCFSIGLTFYNQRFIHHFKLPLSLTMSHLVVKFMLAGMFRSFLECHNKKPRILLGWKDNLKRIAPTGFASIFDIALSNWSFEFITVSLYTMTKSTAVIFILGFSLLFRLEKPRFLLIFVVLFISGGLFMFTYHSTQFNTEGFLMVLSASLLSGLRWTLAQIVTQKNEIGLHNPLDMMYHVQPWMIVGLIPIAAVFEGMELATTENFFRYTDVNLVLQNIALVLAGALLAFFLEFSEFLLLANTSSLTLSIAGIFKEVCTLYLAATVNGDEMNLINGLGLVVCLLGISLHVVLKAVHRNKSNRMDGKISQGEAMEMLQSNGTANDGFSEDDEEDIFNVHRDR